MDPDTFSIDSFIHFGVALSIPNSAGSRLSVGLELII